MMWKRFVCMAWEPFPIRCAVREEVSSTGRCVVCLLYGARTAETRFAPGRHTEPPSGERCVRVLAFSAVTVERESAQ